MTQDAIEMIDVDKWFGDFQVLKGINLNVKPGDRVVICGPSGSGKSTVVRCINRLEAHQKGVIKIGVVGAALCCWLLVVAWRGWLPPLGGCWLA